MKRRTFLLSMGTMTLAGCTAFKSTEREAEVQPLDLGLERRTILGFFYENQELGRFGAGTGGWANEPYGFSVGVSSEDGLEWLWCEIEFTFPDDIRPPFLYLQGDTTVPISSFDRRDITDEFTILEIQKPIDEFDFSFIAVLADPSDNSDKLQIKINFEGVLVDRDQDTKYHSTASISLTLLKNLE